MKIIDNKRARRGNDYVYFANCETGFIKIGYTSNPEERLKAVSRAHHIPIKEFFLVEGDIRLERIMHKAFSKYRMYAEWFFVDYKKVKKYIENYEYNHVKEKKSFSSSSSVVVCDDEIKAFVLGLDADNKIEEYIVLQQIHYASIVAEMVRGGIEIQESMIKELAVITIRYNGFLKECSIKTGEEDQIIKENEKMLAEIARKGFIEVSDTEGKDDKQIYQMVKAWIDSRSNQ